MATDGENVSASSSNFEEEIKKLMGKGKVHMVCSEFVEAVKCFEEATKKLDEKHGEAADQCGEAYFYYGKSLLEVARMEGGVLGNALQGAIESNTQENGTDTKGEKSEEGKCEEEKKESSDATGETPKETKTDDEKAKENDIFVHDEVDESEKEKISADVLDAMTEGGTKESTEENNSTTEDKMTSDAKQDDGNKMEATSEGKDESKTDKPSEVEMVGDEKKPKEKVAKDVSEKEDVKKDEDKGNVAEETKEENKQEETAENKDENQEEGEEENDEDNDEEEEDAENMETGDDKSEEAEDEPTYMELAWQMLEMARIIFSKRNTKEGKLMLGQCHLKLGEIQMEQEQFLSAVEDFLKCLDLQKELLSPDDRLLAETAYNIGLAFSFQSMYDKSKDYYSQALETINLRIKSLEESIKEAESKSKGKGKATPDNPLVANTKELKELQELYPEIKLKVDDAEEMMKQAKDKPSISSVMGNGGSTTTIGFGDSSSSCNKDHQQTTLIATKKKPVAATDISHLVHRNKRKPEEAEDDDSTAKKPRQDTADAESNGKPAETTNNNGQPAAMET